MPSIFEQKAQDFFLKKGLVLTRPFPIAIGFSTNQKIHKFDLGSEEPKTLVECKEHTWTKERNIPSAKLSVWNEAMLYFVLAPATYRTILFVKRSMINDQSLAQYYIKSFGHLIPPGVEIWEFDTERSIGACVYPYSNPPTKTRRQINPGNKIIPKMPMVSIDDFKTAIKTLFQSAQLKGQETIRIKAGDLHEQVVGSRSTPNRMPSCCSAIWSFRGPQDKIVYRPPKGKGANLEIEFRLPR